MSVTIKGAALAEAMGLARHIIEARTTIPILANVLIDAADGALTLSFTNLDQQAVVRADCAVDTPIRTTVDGTRLLAIAAAAPADADVTMAADDKNGLVVRFARSKYRLPTLPASDFPIIATGDMQASFTLPARDLMRMMQATANFRSTEEARYYLCGTFLTAGTSLRAIATNTHGVVQLGFALPNGAEAMPDAIVPEKACRVLADLAGKAGKKAEAALAFMPGKLRVTVGAVTLTSKLIDGNFPDTDRVFPPSPTILVTVDADQWTAAIRRLALISGDKDRAVKVMLIPGMLQLSMASAAGGEALEEIPVDYAGEPFTIGFSDRYAMNIVEPFDGAVTLGMSAAESPVLVTAAGNVADRVVIMPLRI